MPKSKVPTLKMNDGLEIPVLGLGTYARSGSNNKECQLAVEAALSLGYRHIDTAAFYFNEEEVGEAINNKIADGTVTREEVFLTTKLWNDFHEEAKVVPALRDSLDRLGLDYVDLYLIHWPISVTDNGEYSEVDYVETWRGMEECQRLGLCNSIGVSNFNEEQLDRLLDSCNVPPAVNQVECNPNLTQKSMRKFCKDRDVLVTAYCPLGSMPETKTSAEAPAPRIDDPKLIAIGQKYGKNTTQVVLRFLVDSGLVVIPKSVTPSRIKRNIDIFDFKLTAEEMATLESFNKDHRLVGVAFWRDHKFYPF